MFGHFINHNRLIHPQNGFYTIEIGTPLVAIYNSEDFFYKGIVNYIQFGIFSDNKTIICQVYENSTRKFSIKEVSFTDFAFYGCDLYEYTPEFSYNKIDCLTRARQIKQIASEFLYSTPGDDFVFMCMTGNLMYELSYIQNIGLQYLTPYFVGNVIRATHHAISIENGYVIHFSGRRLSKGKMIKFDTFELFKSETQIAQYVPYNSDNNIFERIWARNRAMFALCGKCMTEDYNLILNNCEHFCTWCKTGEKRSKQLKQLVFELAAISLSIITKKPFPPAIKALQKRIKLPWQKH